MKKVDKVKVTLDEEVPLRGVVKCHCGTPLTGAPSLGKSGKYFTIINVSIRSVTT
ncbi:hypothetical protein ACFPVY_02385 [Flavobacterium qiangtangense]|uniref:Uncharacterized protein n=1 Tax=Flavobacterium qiangtangense TaxID=1442595 RepID=A0ABW1PJI7_9FLAO